jgi:hypothetical protein
LRAADCCSARVICVLTHTTRLVSSACCRAVEQAWGCTSAACLRTRWAAQSAWKARWASAPRAFTPTYALLCFDPGC